jgi:hypothetical protein
LAGQYELLGCCDLIETSGDLRASSTLADNGVTRGWAYGQYLGNRCTGFANLPWMSGNDCGDLLQRHARSAGARFSAELPRQPYRPVARYVVHGTRVHERRVECGIFRREKENESLPI